MKVLFAVNNESISEAIIKKYQQEYKEIISSKNVYYFDAITRELQKDKTYDRIVISEDVEPFTNNNYGVIDNFIFKRLDAISDEATTQTGQDIPIILICADRRTKSEDILVKLFGIGIYSALLGQDRTISKVCELINKPRSKKDAKIYYRIDADDVEYKSENEGDVNEVEIQNILTHYKRLGKNEEEYVKSFDNIAEQYTDAQLRVICKFLPLNVKAVLEASSQKYQELITFGTATPSRSQTRGKQTNYVPNQDYQIRKSKNDKNAKKVKNVKLQEPTEKIEVLEKNIGKSELTKPVVIPAGMENMEKVDAQVENKISKPVESSLKQTIHQIIEQQQAEPIPTQQNVNDKGKSEAKENSLDHDEIENILQSLETNISEQDNKTEAPKKRRGRPRKVQENIQKVELDEPKRKRGRPRKVQELDQEKNNQAQEAVDLFGLGANDDDKDDGGLILPGLDSDTEDTRANISSSEPINLFGLGNENNKNVNNELQSNSVNEIYSNFQNSGTQSSMRKDADQEQARDLYNVNNGTQNNSNLENLLSMSNKLVAFVGTSKNGTSFLVNSMAEILSKNGIKTAILDLTQNKNSYYIYTQNDEELRKIAFSCIENLQNGVARGIEVSKNLTVFTTLPDRNQDFNNSQEILKTLMQNYSLVIMDCDYETDYSYFNYAQEIYLVQSYDILTIQPLTAFLRNLKAKNILNPNKLRIVLNKVLRVRSITDRVIIGGMSSYNDPSMSYMTELFDKDNVKYCTIPFDQEAYSRYLDGLVNCEISTRAYPKNIMASLENLGNMIYPLLNNDRPANKFNTYNSRTSNFSSTMNETLNRMKNRY